MQILVLGMHRSGTSIVARLLNMMGIYFGPEGAEMPAHASNPKGFWERRDVNDLCNQLLRRAGCNWNRLSTFDLNQLPAEAIEEFQNSARQITLGLDAHRPWFVKEPRLCILAPLWLDLLERPVCLFVNRSPPEIARSIHARDGFSIPFGLALWERHMTAALNATTGLPRLQVSHQALMRNPVAVVRDLKERLINFGIPDLRLPAKAEIEAFIDLSLYRAKENSAGPSTKLSKAQNKLWRALKSETALSSETRMDFSSEGQALLVEHDHAALNLVSQVSEARLQVRRREDEIRTLTAAKEKADQTTFIAQQIHDVILRGVQTLRQDAKADAARDAEIARLRQVHMDASVELKRRQNEIDGLRQNQANAASEVSRRDAELVRLRQDKERTRNELNQLDATVAKVGREHDEAVTTVRNRETEIAHLKQELETQSKAAASRASDLRAAEAKIVHLKQEIQTRSHAEASRGSEIQRVIDHLRLENDELRRVNRILTKGIDKVETYFGRLRASRSFHFMVYTARRLGLVSRTPRRYVEMIKNHFPMVRKAVRAAKAATSRPAVGKGSPESSVEKGIESDPAPLDATQTPASESEVVATAEVNPFASLASSVLTVEPQPVESEETKVSGENEKSTRPKPDLIRERRIAAAESYRVHSSAKNGVSLPAALPGIEQFSVCFIVLHRQGEQHLRSLFSSFLRFNSLPRAEFQIVLHNCTDESRSVIESFRQNLAIQVTEYEENRSFAHSNNRAAEQTSAEYLVFLNNDIIFQDDVTSELLRVLQCPRIGIAGARLLFPPDDPKYPNELQHGGVKFRPDPQHFFYRPLNIGAHIDIFQTPPIPERFPAVTAALAACRRDDFLKAGGFCEDYFYGYEDVDLCLTFGRVLGLRSVSANHVRCIHNESATGRLDSNDAIRRRRTNNIHHLIKRHGWFLRRQWSTDRMADGLFYSDKPLTLAFAVTETTPDTAAGDFFSASELGEACAREFGWNIRYLSRRVDWYDLKDVDVLVTLIDGYELSQMRDAKPGLVKIAWLRNWFERWAARPDFESYDLFLCSSGKAARWIRETQRKPTIMFPLATNPERFAGAQTDSSLRSDYCFTGSYWQMPREIEKMVEPEKLNDYEFAIFGHGWEDHPSLGQYSRGFVPYSELPHVYASTRIVVDDANHVTKGWASVNSRVFDALAADVLVVTNGEAGSAELFGGEIPCYRSAQDLQALLQKYLGNEEERRLLVERLRQRVLAQHTYRHRARKLKSILIKWARSAYRIGIKIGAPTRTQIQHWGDYHFALSLGRCFAEQGHSFRIDCIDEWERPETFGDDVVIVLRGLSRYQPKPGQINIMWNISHPDKISDEEYEEFDHVFVASRVHANDLAERLTTPVSNLLQCTDPYLFYPDPNPAVPKEELLFVGNSRKQYRESVRLALEAGFPVAIYGTFWSGFVPIEYIRNEYIDNSVLRQHYSRCSILLNDHWPSMRDLGFISNRLFDAGAAGAFVLSDAVQGASALFHDSLVTYRNEDEFRDLIAYYLGHPEERREKAAKLRECVLENHTFSHRASVILRCIGELDAYKRSPERLRMSASQAVYV